LTCLCPPSRPDAVTHALSGRAGTSRESATGAWVWCASTTTAGRTPDPRPPNRALDRTFRVSVILKGLDGALEIVGGLLFLLVSPATIQSTVRHLTQHELSEDPHDFIATHLLRSTRDLSHGTTLFAAIYLLSHGIAKVVLVVAVLRDQIWAYPAIIVLLVGFIIYQLYRMWLDPTIGLALLTAFDAFVVVLTWKEYQARHGHRRQRPATNG
jgi:uncharacterized membrane protein